MRVMTIHTGYILGHRYLVESHGRSRFGMADAADLVSRLDEKTRILCRVGDVAFKARADRHGAMNEFSIGEPGVAVDTELVRRHHKTRVRVFVVTVVATFLGIRRVRGLRLGRFLPLQSLALFRQLLQHGLVVIILAILVCRRHARNTVENGAGNLVRRQRVATAKGCNNNQRCKYAEDFSQMLSLLDVVNREA